MNRGKMMVQLANAKSSYKPEESCISSSSIDDDDDDADPTFDVMKEYYLTKRPRIWQWLDESGCPSELDKSISTAKLSSNNYNYTELKRISPIVPYVSTDKQKVQPTETQTIIGEALQVTSSGIKGTCQKNMANNSNSLQVPNQLWHNSPFLNKNKYKKTICKFCEDEIISRHFARHLQRRHVNETAVKEIFDLPKSSLERKKMICLLRNEGNLDSALRGDVIPKRRDATHHPSSYEICSSCKGYFKRSALSRHYRKCFMNLNTEKGQALSKSQLYIVSLGTYGQFLSKLNVKNQVFSIMKNDDIAKTAQKDPLICLYGENLLKKHRRQQMATVISNKLRECGRFLIAMRQNGTFNNLLSTLKPMHFDMSISAVKIMSGYQEDNKTFKSPSLALHMGTTLKQLSDLAIKLVFRNNPILEVENTEQTLTDLGRFKKIVSSQWTVELSSLAMKDLTEKSSIKAGLLPVTEDIKILKTYTFNAAENAFTELKNHTNAESYKVLIETVLVLAIIHNRKRVGDIQYLELDSYKKQINLTDTEQNEFTNSLSESEKILTKHYKRITTIGKGSRSVTVLIPKELQRFFTLLLNIREHSTIVSSKNKYLFSYPKSDRWINGCAVLRKYAKLSGVKNPERITSSRLRKHIATVTQLLNLKHNEIDQLANFMGHTKKTHETFYKLPQDVYQVAKVSKILQLMEQGKAGNFQNKSLEEIDIDVNGPIEDDQLSDSENELQEAAAYTSKTSTKIHNKSNDSSDSESSQESSGKNKKKTKINITKRKCSTKQKWSDEEVQIIKKHFSKFIRGKQAPKKHDVEEMMKQYPNVFSKRNWVTIKAYVYNCYRDR